MTEFDRIEAYPGPEISETPKTKFEQFVVEWNNQDFRRSTLTWVSLFILLVFYPFISLAGGGDDPLAMLRDMGPGMLLFLLLVTIVFQWFIFLVNYLSVTREQTGLAGLGLGKLRGIHFAWGVSFLLLSFLILSGIAWIMEQLGYPLPGEIGLLIPKDPFGRMVWVLVSFTAGFCEEVAFRGYLMTRIRLIAKLDSWVIPAVVSSVVFGLSHAYQGIPGIILIGIFGGLFAMLYIHTRSLWPCIIAHFFQDLSALFFPQ